MRSSGASSPNLVHEPREPITGDLGALIGRGQRRGRGAREARAAATRGPLHDAPTLMLLDHVQLLLEDLVDDVELGAAALRALLRAERVHLGRYVRG